MIFKSSKIAALIILLSLGACTPKLIPFTHDVRDTLNERGLSITAVQFYNSREIGLSAMDPTDDVGVNKGVVELSNEKNIKEVVVLGETPGKCINEYNDRLDVTFETGGSRFLSFMKKDPADPYSTYRLAVTEKGEGFNRILYDNEQYYLEKDSEYAVLMIQKNKLNKITRQRRVAKGVKVK